MQSLSLRIFYYVFYKYRKVLAFLEKFHIHCNRYFLVHFMQIYIVKTVVLMQERFNLERIAIICDWIFEFTQKHRFCPAPQIFAIKAEPWIARFLSLTYMYPFMIDCLVFQYVWIFLPVFSVLLVDDYSSKPSDCQKSFRRDYSEFYFGNDYVWRSFHNFLLINHTTKIITFAN